MSVTHKFSDKRILLKRFAVEIMLTMKMKMVMEI